MFELSQNDLINAYVDARAQRVPVAQMGNVERGGHFLLRSAGATGDPCLERAITRALCSGEIEVAIDLAHRFIPEAEVVMGRRRGSFSAKGEFVAR